MIIVVEGPDGSGKSTLVNKLSGEFGFSIYRSGGPKSEEDMKDVIKEIGALALNKTNTYICDRVPWISEPVYSKALGRSSVMPEAILMNCFKLPQRILYCTLDDPDLMLSNMSLEHKAHKPKVHTEEVIKNYSRVCKEYEILMAKAESWVSIFRYNWQTVPDNQLRSWI